jgi:DNA-binding NarL/FixJ family response regulator
MNVPAADTAPPVARDITEGTEPEILSWPYIERRKADRRQGGDRRRATPRPDALTELMARECTDRERQIVRLLQQGMTNKEIGTKLGIAEGTVKKHLHHVFKKLGVRRRALLIADAAAASRSRRNIPSVK